MTEDNTQDMAMEDILSSIKNILEEDAANQVAGQVLTEEPIIDTQAEVNVEDILELSPDMKIDETPLAAEPTTEINLDAELNNLQSPEQIETPEVPETVSEPVTMEIDLERDLEDVDSDPFDAELEPQVEPEAILESEPEVISEPTVAPEPEVISEPEPEPVVIPEPEPVFVPEPIIIPEPEPIFASGPELLTKVEEKADAVDVSASIISNFTKMFSAKEPKPVEKPVAPVVAEPINLIGDGSKTIEDVIANVIRNIIGSEVEQNWRGQADYDTFAREVITAQAKEWLETNLPTIVETIVKQEIERVMAKVGSNQ